MQIRDKKTYIISPNMLIVLALCLYIIASLIYKKLPDEEESRNKEEIEILYISQEELLDLEKKRIGVKKFQDRDMFLGKLGSPTKVTDLIYKFANNFKDKDHYVIYSVGPVVGDSVRSISEEIHKLIIDELGSANE